MFKIVGIVLVIVIALIVGGLFYLNHWVKFFVDAAIQRDNRWYRDEGHQMLNPDWQNKVPEKNQHTYDDFWLLENKWSFETPDHLKLVAAVFLSDSHKWVICVHGYRSNGFQDMADAAMHYYQKGYNVLVPDLRAHGQSAGKIIGLGWQDRWDLIGWIDQIIEKDPEAEIVLHGGSMGAATVLMASGEKLPDNVQLLIADSSYTSVYSEFKGMLKRLTQYPINRFMELANSYSKKVAGYSLLQASVTRQLGSNHLPVLFLHGKEDKFVPVTDTDTLMEATAGEKQLQLFDGAGHLQAKEKYPTEYWQTVDDFLKKYGW